MADAAFATDGVALAAALNARGCTVLMAGKPGPAEAALREAGVKAFVYQGADLVRTLAALFEQGGVS
jgi:methylmalonyl-CoA mutase